VPVLVADGTDEIADRLVTASIAVSRMSEVGVNREALAEQLLQAGVPRSSDPSMPGRGSPVRYDDTIL
jgi:hypothetical protein